MKRALLALALALVAILATQGAAQAFNWSEMRQATSCNQTVCLDVWYKRDQDNTGFYLSQVEISGCDGAPYNLGSCHNVDGHSLKCMNANGATLWSATNIDLGQADAKSWTPNATFGAANELKCVYNADKVTWLGGSVGFTDTVDRT